LCSRHDDEEQHRAEGLERHGTEPALFCREFCPANQPDKHIVHQERIVPSERSLNHPAPILNIAGWHAATCLPVLFTSLIGFMTPRLGLAVASPPEIND